jgi:hypothetical protein
MMRNVAGVLPVLDASRIRFARGQNIGKDGDSQRSLLTHFSTLVSETTQSRQMNPHGRLSGAKRAFAPLVPPRAGSGAEERQLDIWENDPRTRDIYENEQVISEWKNCGCMPKIKSLNIKQLPIPIVGYHGEKKHYLK